LLQTTKFVKCENNIFTVFVNFVNIDTRKNRRESLCFSDYLMVLLFFEWTPRGVY